jgi:Spy/CpxP family protein refolding chaperone
MRASRFLAVALFVAGAVLVVEAQQPRRGGGGFGLDPTVLVVNNKDLQEELKVTDAQKEKFAGVIEKQKKQAESFKGAFGGGGFDKEKFAEIQKERTALNDEIKKVVAETLTPDQTKRLKQIERQAMGVRAFTDENVAADLKLTDDQKSKVKGIVEEYGKDVRELGGFGGGGGKGGFKKGDFDKEKLAENQKKREKLAKAAIADVEDVLTADQRKQWKEMTGAAFDTSKLRQGFGFGGGFGGNRGKGKNKTKDE